MRDVTNGLINLGKDLEEQTFCLAVTWDELNAIVALAQNPHIDYQKYEESMRIYKEIFESGKRIRDNAQANLI